MATIICPTCSAQYRISDDKISEKSRLRCKKCGAVFRLHDTIKLADELPLDHETPPKQSASRHEPYSPAPSPSEANTLEFDLASIQLHAASSSQTTEPLPPQEDLPLDMNLGELALDFGPASHETSEGETLSFGPLGIDDAETSSEGEDIHDHIAEITIDQPQESFAGFSFGGDEQQGRTAENADENLDFSFSANIPEDSREEEGIEEEEGFAKEGSEESYEPSVEQDLGAELNLELPIEKGTEPPPGQAQELPLSPEAKGSHEEPEHLQKEEAQPEEPLQTCCIDSLAMGLLRCEICGRDLKNKHQHAVELQQQRRRQLKEELVKAEVQIGFSDDQHESGTSEMRVVPAEDFSDVERALDALADGSFQESLKKKEARQTLAKTIKMVVAVAVIFVVVIGGVIWYLLPSPHEKLLVRYEELVSQQEVDPTSLVRLFLDAAIEKDEDIFQKITVMSTLPDISSGKILGASDEYEKTSIGKPGQRIVSLQEEIAAIEKQISEKTKLLNEYSSKTFSPVALEETLKSLEKRVSLLQAEFEAKDAENSQKLRGLQKELRETENGIQENRQISQKYLDAVDTVGKALYTNSVTKLRSLAEQKARLESQIQQEHKIYQQYDQKLKTEYDPQFAELDERIAQTKAMLQEASLLQDANQSPVVILSKELEQLTQMIIDKKSALEQTEQQLNEALNFFLSPEKKNRILKEQNSTEFSHVSKNVAVLLKVGKSSEQQASIVLKRYEAIVSDATLQSNWLIEKIAK